MLVSTGEVPAMVMSVVLAYRVCCLEEKDPVPRPGEVGLAKHRPEEGAHPAQAAFAKHVPSKASALVMSLSVSCHFAMLS
jgi:hypothetical protein